jgi:murein DD-endopeptidase MepM/ murein hydrolase activator NlpD
MQPGVALVSPCNGNFDYQVYEIGGGNTIFFHGVDGSKHAFCHLSVMPLPPLGRGAKLVAGVTPLGVTGKSGGECHGPHLHWQIFKHGQPVDPRDWIKGTK